MQTFPYPSYVKCRGQAWLHFNSPLLSKHGHSGSIHGLAVTAQVCVEGCSPCLATTGDLPSRPCLGFRGPESPVQVVPPEVLVPEVQGGTGKFLFLASSQGGSCCCSRLNLRTIALHQSFLGKRLNVGSSYFERPFQDL